MRHLLNPTLIGILALFSATSPSLARYLPPSLVDLLGKSDLVAVGVIAEVQASAFVLRLENTIAGSPGGSPGRSTIRIERFENWACSTRWKPYLVGQRLLVMVRAVEHEDYEFAHRSAGWESEFPIVEGHALAHSYQVPGAETVPFAENYVVPSIPLETVVEATLDLRRCWDLQEVFSPEPKCSAEETTALRTRSGFHRRLLEKLPDGK
ncbi:MAG: hypothetical protein MI919_32385 [Holophagales bacterium]|nr:hypothetical protein [Holophagales bacterium]